MCKDLTPTDVTDVPSALRFLIDIDVVSDVAQDYGEPGYSLANPDGVFAIGYWWCRDRECDYDGATLCHSVEEHYPRLFAILEDGGVETDFYDEWYVDPNTSKAYRTQPDSYSWQSSIMWDEKYGEYLTPDDDVSLWVEAVVNNPNKCIPAWISDADLAELGYVERQCNYESGWYGKEDNPEAITAAILADEPGASIVYKLDRVEQFRVTFCVYVKPDEDEDED